jgi:hypothetical protein
MSNKQKSREQYRQEYLAYLDGEIANQKLNLQANRVFQQTGETRPADPRTITEKIAEEIERGGLRDLAREEVNKITPNPTITFQILNDLDTPKVEFLLQQFPIIQKEVQARFGGKVPSAQIFIDYFDKFIENYDKTKGVVTSTNVEDIVEQLKPSGVFIPEKKALDNANGDYNVMFPLPSENDIFTGTKSFVRNTWKSIRGEIKRQYVSERGLTQQQLNERRFILSLIDVPSLPRKDGGVGSTRTEDIISWIQQQTNEWGLIQKFFSGIQGSGIQGSGIQGCGVAVGIKPTNHYCDFGDYLLHTSKLDDDNIVLLKTKSKRKITDLPAKKVSRGLGMCIHTLVHGGSIDPKNIARLSDDEKEYLNKIVRRAKINNQVKVPLPSKAKKEAEYERFEILRGQIIAGNDSKELISEFKRLLLKFKKDGIIPTNQANDIMQELLLLGY